LPRRLRCEILHAVRIYLSAFQSSPPKGARPCDSTYGPLRRAIEQRKWPYDNGDDPAFFSRQHFGGNLTWGVCRQNVRNPIGVGDVVVFFSFTKIGGVTEYKPCAVATVQEKVRQTDLWIRPGLKWYRRYLNLLISPKGKTWQHNEPGANKWEWHGDWLWRIANHKGLHSSAFKRSQTENKFSANSRLGNRPLTIAANYIIFSADPKLTFVAKKHPPVVARSNGTGCTETWGSEPFSRGVKGQTVSVALAHGGRGTLRTSNRQRAHPHVRWEMNDSDGERWRERLIALLRTI